MSDDGVGGPSAMAQDISSLHHRDTLSIGAYPMPAAGVEQIQMPPFPSKARASEPAALSHWERDIEAAEKVYDRGYVAWLTVCGAWMVQFCTYGYASSFGVYQDFYSRSFLSEASPSDISWIGSIQLFLQYGAGLFVGAAFDAGLFRQIVILGVFLHLLSLFMLSLAEEHHYYQVLLTQGIGMGFGQALLFLPSLTVVGDHFRQKRALAIGITVSGSSVGGIFWPIVLNHLSQVTTFANAIRITAAICGIMLLISLVLMKPQPRRQVSSTHSWSGVRFMIMDPPYIVSVISAFCINIGLFFPYFYLQTFALTHGVTKSLAFYLIAILNTGSFFGRLLPALAVRKLGVYNLLILSLLFASGFAFAMLGITGPGGMIVFALLYGFFSGSYISLIPSLLAYLSRHPGEIGVRMGLAFSFVSISVLVGTPIEGAILRSQHGALVWTGATVFCGCLIFFGTLGMSVSQILFRITRSGRESV